MVNRREFLRTAGIGLASVPLLGVAGCVGRSVASSGAGPDRPNVIVILIDTLRKDHVGVYGNEWIATPNIDALARESLRFTRAFPESLVSIPIRRAVHTGLRTFPFRDWVPQKGDRAAVYGWQRIPEDQTTLAETLRDAGYATAFITDAYHQWKPSMNFNRGFDRYEWVRGQELDPYRVLGTENEDLVQGWLPDWARGNRLEDQIRQHAANVTGTRASEEDYFGPTVFRTASTWLREAAVEPFFLIVDSYDPHEPWDPPDSYVERYSDAFPPWRRPEPITPIYGPSDYLADGELERMRALYAAETTMVDRWIGRFLDTADETGLLDRSTVIFLADHGIAIGDHGLTGKMPYALYPELIDIPMLIRDPEGTGAGQVTDAFASTHDITPTVLGVTEVAPRQELDGLDLTPLLRNPSAVTRSHLTSGFNNYVWARDDEWVLIARNDGEDARLYDLSKDPDHERNVAARHPDVVRRLFRQVLSDAGGAPLSTYDFQALGRVAR